MSENVQTSGLGFYNCDFFKIKTNEDLVEESIVRIIMTNFNERVGHANFGGDLKHLLFEQQDEETLNKIESHLYEMIEIYEPRALIRTLTVKSQEDNTVNINIEFNYIGNPNADPRLIPLIINLE